ncbi:MAG: anaerobic ribonucleoside-triphosphate reductase, partial [Promethearchaeota archaeon]
REYINGILLERGFESVRHELTRLGTPPHEVRRLMAMNQYNHAPDKIIYQLGSDVSEQFLLLNVLPNYLADSYLSGELALLQLNYWWLRPLGFFLDTKTLLNENVLKRALQTNNKLALMSLLTSFLEYLFQISPFYSQDLLIGNFNTEFISVCDSLEEEKKKMFFDILARQFNHFNVFHNINNSRLALEFTTHEMDNIKHTNSKSNELILDQLNQCLIKPFIFYDYTNLDLKLNPEIVQDNFIYYDGLSLSLINSLIVNVRNSRENQENSIILDKILINLQEIAMQASYSDNRFHDLVQEKLDLVFDLFRCKSRLMQKNLNSNKEWIKLINTVFKWRSKDWINEAIKSVSFYGLNEAIKHHCGIEMDRIDKSEAFAINILKLLKNLIKEKNENEGEKYVLGQPHQGNYLNSNNEDSKSIEYETSIVRTDSNLRLEQKITMFKRFERILSGGALFNHNSSSNENIFEIFKILSNSKLSAFSINGNLV